MGGRKPKTMKNNECVGGFNSKTNTKEGTGSSKRIKHTRHHHDCADKLKSVAGAAGETLATSAATSVKADRESVCENSSSSEMHLLQHEHNHQGVQQQQELVASKLQRKRRKASVQLGLRSADDPPTTMSPPQSSITSSSTSTISGTTSTATTTLNNESAVAAPPAGRSTALPLPISGSNSIRLIRNNLSPPTTVTPANYPASLALHHHGCHVHLSPQQVQQLTRIQFASGAPLLIASSAASAVTSATPAMLISTTKCSASHSSASSTSAVRIDLTSAGGSVRAEVAFTGAFEPATSATPSAAASLGLAASSGSVAAHQTANSSALSSRQVFQHLQQQQHQYLHQFVQVRNPLCVPRQSDFLSSWRTCMVPIVALESFASMKPPCPRWRHLAKRTSGGTRLRFSLMCYNILCDQYASSKSYWYCPEWALAWCFRRHGILENISLHLPSVVCLQEVETEQFYSFFLPHLSHRGYEGIFSPKSRAKTMDDRLRKRVDGCAIFWKRSEFCLVEEHVIEFSQQYLEQCWTTQQRDSNSPVSSVVTSNEIPSSTSPASDLNLQQQQPLKSRSSEIFNRVTIRDNIALAVILSPVEKATVQPQSSSLNNLMVCTSHIHWDPQFSDVKLIQTVVLTSALAAKIKQFSAANEGAQLPLILCGDFNSLPNSGVIEFLNQGSVERDHPEFQRLGCDPSLDGLKLVGDSSQSSCFSHSLNLASCYSSVDVTYTNYTHEFKGVIDYIFASRSHFRVLDCLEGMAEWFRAQSVIGCPHPYVPSDHIPLAVQLEMTIKSV